MTDERKSPKYSPDILRLIEMDKEMIYAKDISPIVKMKTEVIIWKVKHGEWDEAKKGNVEKTKNGYRVKFYRIDFLRKGGWI